MPELSDDQVMFSLAGLAYRGVHEPGWGAAHDGIVLEALEQGLRTLPTVAGRWELVWGPATYRAPVSVIDDAMAYVVRDVRRPSRYVVVVRGTNPGSAFDWAFGDLWACHQVAWADDATARVSLSSALGLTLLRRLRSRPRIPATMLPIDDDGSAFLRDVVGRPGLDALRRAFAALVRDLLATREHLAHDVRTTPLGEVAARWQSHSHTLMRTVVAETAPLMNDRADHVLLALLETQATLQERLGAGTSLEQFLSGVCPEQVIVTGHSKGGALASTLALWLHETRDVWAPGSRPDVQCWSFAAPTAGNAAFATRSNDALGAGCRRVVNALDVVPHAWTPSDLAAIEGLYDPASVVPLPTLAVLLGIIAGATTHLDYRHVGTTVTTLPGTLEPTATLFVEQMIHQHMQAYCDLLGVAAHGITARAFFEPRRLIPVP